MKIDLRSLCLMLALAGTACTPTIDNRGNLPHPDLLSQIKPGKTTREEVQTLLGTPSTTMTYGDESWHYISARTETVAFFEPKVLERKVVSVNFDKNGVVKDLGNRELEDGQAIQPIARETPTAGKDMSLIGQLLGNVGRFSKEPAGTGP